MPSSIYVRSPKDIERLKKLGRYPRSEETLAKMSEAMKKVWQTKPTWNKGLTKYTNNSLARRSEKMTGRHPSEERGKAGVGGI